jgi:hypothetical protein
LRFRGGVASDLDHMIPKLSRYEKILQVHSTDNTEKLILDMQGRKRKGVTSA